MRVILLEDKLFQTTEGEQNTWVEQGTYEVVRQFDENRILVDISNNPRSAQRRLTLLRTGEYKYEDEQ